MFRLLLLLSATICVCLTLGLPGTNIHVDAEGHVTCKSNDYPDYDDKTPAGGNLSLVYKFIPQYGPTPPGIILSSIKISAKTGRYRIHGRTFVSDRMGKSVFELQLSYACTENSQRRAHADVSIPEDYFVYEAPGKQKETKVFRHDFDN